MFTGCFCTNSIKCVKWRAKGDDVIFHVYWSCWGGIDSIQGDDLFVANSEFKNKKKFFSSSCFYDHPSSLQNVIIQEYGRIVLVDIDTAKIRYIKEYPSPYPMNVGWSYTGEKYFMTDSIGLKLVTVDDHNEKLILKGKYYGLYLSPNEKFILLKSGRGWPDGNDIYLINTSNENKQTLYSISKGFIGEGYITKDGNTIIFSTEDYHKHISSLLKFDVMSRKVKEIYQCPRKAEEDMKIIPTTNSEKVLLYAAGKLLLVNLSDSKYQILADVYSSSTWDYNPNTKKVIYLNKPSNLKLIELRD